MTSLELRWKQIQYMYWICLCVPCRSADHRQVAKFKLGFCLEKSGRYWSRTSDLHDVNVAL